MCQPCAEEFRRLGDGRLRHVPSGLEFVEQGAGHVAPFAENDAAEGNYDLDDLIDVARHTLIGGSSTGGRMGVTTHMRSIECGGLLKRAE
jgi:hypothetical protein